MTELLHDETTLEASGAAVPADDEDEPADDEELPADDDEPEGHEQPEPEPPPPPASEKEIERAFKALDKEATRHANRVSEIIGEDAQVLVVCELCEPNIPGFHWPAVPDGDPRQKLLDVIAGGAEADYAQAKDTQTCPDCNGYGVVLSGSRRNDNHTVPCLNCNQRGWVGERAARAVPTTVPLAADNGHAEESIREDIPGTDPWGRPIGHEKFGVMPQYDPTYLQSDFARA